MKYRQQAADLYANLSAPTFDRTPYTQYQQTGQLHLQGYDPYTGQAYYMIENPEDRAQQMALMKSLNDIMTNGFSTQDRIYAQQLQDNINANFRNQNTQVMDRMRAQGIGSRGAELASQLAATQGAAQIGNQQGNNLLQSALQNRLAAIAQSGQLAGQIRSQDAQTQLANTNILNSFNTSLQNLRTNAAQYNANVQNQAATYNMNTAQDIANKNTGLTNQQLDRNNNLSQTEYSNALQKTSGQANALGGLATQANAAAAANQQNINAQNATNAGYGAMAGQIFQNPQVQKQVNAWGNQAWNSISGNGPSPMTAAQATAQYGDMAKDWGLA